MRKDKNKMQDDILMSLAISNIVDKQGDFENKIELSKTISRMIVPIVKEREEQESESNDRDNKELPKTVTDEIRERRDNINKIKQDKEKRILVMLGQMYNGVIIPQQLSCRRGEFFRYRCQYALSLQSVKEELMKNLHAVSEKITVSKNLDIMEYVLEKWDKDKDATSNSSSNYYSKRSEKEGKKKDFRFDEVTLIENTNRSNDNPNTSFDFLHTNGVCVFDNGNVEFFYQLGNDRDNQSFQTENFNMLYKKFKNDINGLAEDFFKEVDDEIKARSDELEEIKLRGSHLLMSAELQKGSDENDN